MGKTPKPLQAICLAAAAAVWLIAQACNTAGCTDNRNAIPLAAFYAATAAGGNAAPQPISIDSLAVWGVGAPGDSLLLAPTATASQVYLPLRAKLASTAFCFAIHTSALNHPQLYDTIAIDYTSHPWFVSEDCGAGYRYRITRLTHTSHLIDSVGLVDSLVTNVDRELIKIYFRTQEAPGEEAAQ